MSIRKRVSNLFSQSLLSPKTRKRLQQEMLDKSRARLMCNIFNRFQQVMNLVTMPGLSFYISFPYIDDLNNAHFYMQVKCEGKCNVTGESTKWSGRKWMLSEHMTDQEIVQTALKAVLTAYEHEIREQFKYRGVTVFDPHYDIEKLVELRSQKDSVVQRTPIKPRLAASPGVKLG